MVLSRLDGNTLCLENIECFFDCIINNNLTYTLSYLSLAIEHHATTVCVHFIVVWTTSMTTSAYDLFRGSIWNIVPRGLKVADTKLGNFFIGIIVEASYKISSSITEC